VANLEKEEKVLERMRDSLKGGRFHYLAVLDTILIKEHQTKHTSSSRGEGRTNKISVRA
jgi:hypothetical protein